MTGAEDLFPVRSNFEPGTPLALAAFSLSGHRPDRKIIILPKPQRPDSVESAVTRGSPRLMLAAPLSVAGVAGLAPNPPGGPTLAPFSFWIKLLLREAPLDDAIDGFWHCWFGFGPHSDLVFRSKSRAQRKRGSFLDSVRSSSGLHLF